MRSTSARAAHPPPTVDDGRVEEVLTRIFPSTQAPQDADYTEQRAAARAAVQQWTTVITGGPGTGKTTTLVELVAEVFSDRAQKHLAAAGFGVP